MERLSETVLRHAQGQPEGAPVLAKGLLHLGNRAAVDQAPSRLVRRGALLRAGRGVYVLPVESRFGRRAPSADRTVGGLAAARGERVANSGRHGGERARPDHADARGARLSDVGADPDVDAWPRADRTAPRAGVATGAAWPACRGGGPRPGLAGARQGRPCGGAGAPAIERRRTPRTRQRGCADAGDGSPTR